MIATHPTNVRAAPAAAPVLSPAMRRFARQVQAGFALTLALSLVMLVLHG